jgi:hypothetical protein
MLSIIPALLLNAADVQVVAIESVQATTSTTKTVSSKLDSPLPPRLVQSATRAHIDAQGNVQLSCETERAEDVEMLERVQPK